MSDGELRSVFLKFETILFEQDFTKMENLSLIYARYLIFIFNVFFAVSELLLFGKYGKWTFMQSVSHDSLRFGIIFS